MAERHRLYKTAFEFKAGKKSELSASVAAKDLLDENAPLCCESKLLPIWARARLRLLQFATCVWSHHELSGKVSRENGETVL